MKKIGATFTLLFALLFLGGARPAAAVGPACVVVTASGPGTSCQNCAITLTGVVKNCSLDPETIALTIQGSFVFQQLVPAAATVNFSYPTVAACPGGAASIFNVVATATTGVAPDGQDAQVVVVSCGIASPARPSTWGAIKSIYRA